MRTLVGLFLVVAVLSPGCVGVPCKHDHTPINEDCSYGPGPVRARGWFLDETWNASRVSSAVRSEGFGDLVSTEGAVRARNATTTVALGRETNGTTRLDLMFDAADSGLGYTSGEVRAMMEGAEAAAHARADAFLARFSDDTGWTLDVPLAWESSMTVA